MSIGHTLRLRTGAALVDEDGPLICGRTRVTLKEPDGRTRAALQALAGDGFDAGRPAVEPTLGMLLHQLESSGWIARTLRAGDRALATLEPLAFADVLARHGLESNLPLRSSRFAFVHAVDGVPTIESGHAKARVVLHDPRLAALVARLSTPTDRADLDAAELGLDDDGLDAILRLLLQARILGRVEKGSDAELDEQTLAQWDPVDLLFHSRSRLGRQGGDYGGTYRFKDRFPELPAIREAPGPGLPLPEPDLDALAGTDPSLTRVVESRRSIREHEDSAPIGIAQLGELLHRTARVRHTIDTPIGALAPRPYPGGGALYELDVYPLVRLCADVPAGLHRYDPVGHALVQVSPASVITERLIRQSQAATGMKQPPQVLLVIAARFGRVSWKYEAMAYALTLKHVGVLYQTLYLVATAMGLAPCALGGGDSDLFARAAGLEYEAETSVGEFMIGSRPSGASGLLS